MIETQKRAALLITDAAHETPRKSTTESTKEVVVLQALYTGSLNRFQAERIGDHCLNTSIATLRGKGICFEDEWEKVPSRGRRGFSNVKRYWVAPEPKNIARVRSMLGLLPDGR